MATEFLDSFDHYGNKYNITSKWTTISNWDTLVLWTSGTNVRNGHSITLANAILTKTLTYQTKWTIGVAFKHTGGSGDRHIFGVQCMGSNALAGWLGADETLQIRSWASGALSAPLASSSNALHQNCWNYIELQGEFGLATDSKLTVEAAKGWINGDLEASYTGPYKTSIVPGTGACNGVMFGLSQLVSPWNFDDFYANSGTGINTGNFGDAVIECIWPNGVGSNSDWTPGGTASSTNNWENVTEHTPDEDASYVTSTTTGHIDTWEYEDISADLGEVKAIQINICAKKAAEGTRAIQTVFIHEGTSTTSDGDDKYLSETTYIWWRQCHDQNPVTTAAWSVSDVNNAQFGAKLTI